MYKYMRQYSVFIYSIIQECANKAWNSILFLGNHHSVPSGLIAVLLQYAHFRCEVLTSENSAII